MADVLEWQAGPFDAVLLDAPCSSTGTISRHPDVPWLKTAADLTALTALQQRLLDRAVELLKPGGTLVYCVCSLEPEEGEQQIAALLVRNPYVARVPLTPAELFDHRDSSPRRAICAHCRSTCPTPTRAGAGSTVLRRPADPKAG